MASFSVLTAFWIIKTSQVKEKNKEENRVKKTEDSNYSLPLHFWSTFRSPFSTCYIPFQSSGSQESNTSNRVQFGAKIRKIWLSEDNCIKQVRISHQPMRLWCEISSVLPTPHEIFSFVFFEENSFLIPVISQSQALLL